MFRLHAQFQNYDWGKIGSTSAVAQLVNASSANHGSGSGPAVDEKKPYAEYWFGTHASGPSKVIESKDGGAETFLQDWLVAHPDALGAAPYKSDSALPYLLKVLSIGKPLSVQAHPDRTLAARLHASRPDMYKDDNHKPELACALTPFDGLCGFRPAEEIVANVARTPELVALIGEDKVEALRAQHAAGASGDGWKAALREAFGSYMSKPQSEVDAHAAALEARLRAAPAGSLSEAEAVALRLCNDFPKDVGVFAPFLLNLVTLRPGEAVFLAANEPHAYLSGDCVEVMACSDNVVRAGLTPKWKDVPTLTEMLTYRCGKPEISTGAAIDARTSQYPSPVPEFVLQRTEVPAATTEAYTLPAIPSAAIVVVIDGEADCNVNGSTVTLKKGDIYLQAANSGPVALITSSSQRLLMFRAHANPAFNSSA